MKKILFGVIAVVLCSCGMSDTEQLIYNHYANNEIKNAKIKLTLEECELIDSITNAEYCDFRINFFDERNAFEEERLELTKSELQYSWADVDKVNEKIKEQENEIANNNEMIEWLKEQKAKPNANCALAKCFKVTFRVVSSLIDTKGDVYFWLNGEESKILMYDEVFDKLDNSIGELDGYLDKLHSL